jgi:hypothetical protein
MTDKEVMQMALTALCNSSQPARGYRRNELHLTPKPHIEIYQEAIEALRTALAQPEPKPVAWWHDMGDVVDLNASGRGTPLYFAPPQREWQGLTDEEVAEMHHEIKVKGMGAYKTEDIYRAIESKIKEKNT